jgi:hypothetical protein
MECVAADLHDGGTHHLGYDLLHEPGTAACKSDSSDKDILALLPRTSAPALTGRSEGNRRRGLR